MKIVPIKNFSYAPRFSGFEKIDEVSEYSKDGIRISKKKFQPKTGLPIDITYYQKDGVTKKKALHYSYKNPTEPSLDEVGFESDGATRMYTKSYHGSLIEGKKLTSENIKYDLSMRRIYKDDSVTEIDYFDSIGRLFKRDKMNEEGLLGETLYFGARENIILKRITRDKNLIVEYGYHDNEGVCVRYRKIGDTLETFDYDQTLLTKVKLFPNSKPEIVEKFDKRGDRTEELIYDINGVLKTEKTFKNGLISQMVRYRKNSDMINYAIRYKEGRPVHQVNYKSDSNSIDTTLQFRNDGMVVETKFQEYKNLPLYKLYISKENEPLKKVAYCANGKTVYMITEYHRGEPYEVIYYKEDGVTIKDVRSLVAKEQPASCD